MEHNSLLPERVQGPNLLLRRWVPDDLELLAATIGRNREHLRPWMAWADKEPLSIDQRLELLKTWDLEWREGGDVVLAVLLGDHVVGGTGLHHRVGPRGLEIGYWVDVGHLRRGIGTETAAMLTTAALSVPDIDFVEIHHDKANVRSGRIPQRLGYRFLGETPDRVEAPREMGIECVWQITGSRWPLRAFIDANGGFVVAEVLP